MSMVKIRGEVDVNGILTARVPPSVPNGSIEVFLDVPSQQSNGLASGTGDSKPFGERLAQIRGLYGAIDDPTLMRPNQGEFEVREFIE